MMRAVGADLCRFDSAHGPERKSKGVRPGAHTLVRSYAAWAHRATFLP